MKEELYHPIILEANRHPKHFEVLTDPDLQIEAYNPLCGDEYRIFMQMSSGRLEQVSFHGYGCAVSKASSSMMVERLRGKTVTKAIQFLKEFLEAFTEGMEMPDEGLNVLLVAREYPARATCVTLPWEKCLEVLVELS